MTASQDQPQPQNEDSVKNNASRLSSPPATLSLSPPSKETAAASVTATKGELTETTKKLKWLLGVNYGDKPLLQRINYLHLTLLTATPAIAIYGIMTSTIRWETVVFAFLYYLFTGLGITAGYHRLFAHKAYEASPLVKYCLLFAGAGAFEGSVRWWARDHRAHHRYVDTPKDPYSFKNGFWYAHLGWMLVKQDKSAIGKVECDDLYEDPWISWQHRNYLTIALTFAFIVPTIIAGLCWGDFRGGFFIAGVARLVFVHHSTFSINSLAHYTGSSTYSDQHTAKNSFLTSLVTVGEGYHNFHHEFPSDYRNGVMWYQFDPTKVLIRFLSYLGLTYNLKRFPANEIQKGYLQMKKKLIDEEMSKLSWGPNVDTLPLMTKAEVETAVKNDGKRFLILNGFVLDIAKFAEEHPGGKAIINAYIGKDVTEAFTTTVYRHSNAAKNLQATYRVAKISTQQG